MSGVFRVEYKSDLDPNRCDRRKEKIKVVYEVKMPALTLPFATQPSLTNKEEFSPELIFTTDQNEILKSIHRGVWDTWEAFTLRLRAEELVLHRDFSELLILSNLKERWEQVGMVPYEHQINTVKKVIEEMRGRAILADEVGLGKTIEAGMIVKEYLLRGLVKKTLILTPASLCRQWAAELSQKFALYPVIPRYEFEWAKYDLIVASIDTAKQEKNRQALQEIYFDLVVVDEAHKLKNPLTQNWQFVSSLRKKFFLLLTATPLQNDLKELFNLISLLRPGQLGSYKSFRRRFVQDKRTAKNHEELRTLLGQVMIRNKRGPQITLPPRKVATMPLTPTAEEMALYRAITDFVRTEYRKGERASVNPLTLLTLQREVCSSSFAAANTLYKLCGKASAEDQKSILSLLQMAAGLKENTKMNLVEEILRQAPAEKMIIFTEYLATQEYILARLRKRGIPALTFDGKMSASKKDFTIGRFRNDPRYPVLICTESGGEGINLQFCRSMINYDLPWNPMRLEQRIGRIHRLGQTREIYVYNLVTQGTIEERLLRLLVEKVRLFEVVIGDLQRIINCFGRATSFESKILKALIEAETEAELDRNLLALGEEIVRKLEKEENTLLNKLL